MKKDLLPSNDTHDVSSVASHTCTSSNSTEHTQQYFPVEFAGLWTIRTEPFYNAKDILDEEDVGADQAEKNAIRIARLLDKYGLEDTKL
jgi:hypothetical protein